MADPYDDSPDPAPAAATQPQPAFAQPVEAPVTDVERAQGYLRQHEAQAQKYGANFDDIMKQRKEAIAQVQGTLNQIIQEMRDKHEGKGPWQVNLPLANFSAGVLSGVGPGAGNFGAQMGAGMGRMAGSVERQRMQDSEFLKGVAELQAKSGEMGDVPLKDAAQLAKMAQLREQQSQGALERGIVTAKLDKPASLGKDAMGNPVIWDPRANGGQGSIIGAGGKAVDLNPQAIIDAAGGKTGDEFLKSLPKDSPYNPEAIKGYATYDTPLPTGARSPAVIAYQQGLFALAKQYNPDFDVKQYATIQKGQKDWTGNGQSALQARAAANVSGHLDNMQSVAAGLDNGDFAKWNTVANWIQNNKGDPRVMAFETAKKAVMTELSSFLGKGHPAEGQIREWQDVVSNANSPKALQGAIEQMATIMHTQLENMGTAKTNDLGGKKQFDAGSFLSDSNKQSLKNILTTDISTDGGRFAALRRAENKKAAITGADQKPNPPQAVWESNAALLKKAPTPANRAYFDQTFGPGSAKLVLGK